MTTSQPLIITPFENVPSSQCHKCLLDCCDPWNNPNKECPRTTLYYVPVMPIKNRYPEEWYHQFEEEFERLGVEYITIDGDMSIPVEVQRKGYDMFTSLDLGAKWELNQLQKLLTISDQIKDGDIIFFTDIDFPGFCLPFAQLIKLKVPGVKLFGYIHAGSYCNGDIFSNIEGKFYSEKATFRLFDGIFVGSQYHKSKIIENFAAANIHVVGAPFYFDKLSLKFKQEEYDVLYSTRIDNQDKGEGFLKIVKDNPKISFVCTFKPSRTPNNLTYYPTNSREEYFELLSKCNIYVSTAKESTFGYAVLEAMAAGLRPVIPKKFSFPEIVGNLGIYYSEFSEISDKIKQAIDKKKFTDKEILRREKYFKNYELSIEMMIRKMVMTK